ncbi:MAG TPA: hemerythrin domain-containing protein [Phycisphaerae bacterium]|nr:hemerythrin domain-containing protein [Phycisphaerae bacterium]
MTTHTLASWIQEEHARISELSDRLQERVAVVPKAAEAKWIEDVESAFAEFRLHVERHQSLEEEGGYMTGVLEKRPTLARVVEQLMHEHGEMRRIMEEIEQRLMELSPDDKLLIRDACHRIQALLQYMEHHARQEDLLLMSLFKDDGDGGD